MLNLLSPTSKYVSETQQHLKDFSEEVCHLSSVVRVIPVHP